MSPADADPPESVPPRPRGAADPASGSPSGEAAAELEERRRRAARAVRGALAGALVLEGIAVLLVPRAIAPLDDRGLSGGALAMVLGLVAALFLAAGLQRVRAGLVLGGVLQLAVIATGVLLPAMYVLGLVFAGVWVYLLRVRQDVARATGAAPTP